MAEPSKSVNIDTERRPPLQHQGSFTTPVGTPDARAFRAAYTGRTPPRNIPPRAGTPGSLDPSSPPLSLLPPPGTSVPRFSSFPGPSGLSASLAASQSVTPEVTSPLELPEDDKARVLRKHLMSKAERKSVAAVDFELPNDSLRAQASTVLSGSASDGGSSSSLSSANTRPAHPTREDSEAFPVAYDTHGADVTHNIYKWHANQTRQARPRAASHSGAPPTVPHPAFEHIHEPGGFRRNYVILRANEQGVEEPRMLANFVDFLYLFGSFAGEDLEEEEDEEDDKDDEEANDSATIESPVDLSSSVISERQPLIQREGSRSMSRSKSRRRRMSVSGTGEATVLQAVLMLLKSFVGTGVLFLGKAFYNGGLLFSTVTIVVIALISLYSFLLLVKTKFVVSGSFGDLGGTLYGPWMRYAILGSIIVSQLGFVSAYTIFVAQNLQAFYLGVTHCIEIIGIQWFILIQLVILLPLALVRDLAKLSTTALVADAFILTGLIYIFGSEIGIVAKQGIADVQMFNPKDFPLFIGTAVFSFEGIGLVIPITDSMREPRKFPKVLSGVMVFLMFLFGGAGALSYLTFGSEVQTVVIVNLDSGRKEVQAVQFLYAMAILLSIPLQLFPAVRIMENGLFVRSGKTSTRVKWQKNMFRALTAIFCAVLSWVGASDLDKFVSFIGSFACVPLCYIYPAMLHYRACAKTRSQKLADIALMLFGAVAAIYTTVQTVRLMVEPEPPTTTPVGSCPGTNTLG